MIPLGCTQILGMLPTVATCQLYTSLLLFWYPSPVEDSLWTKGSRLIFTSWEPSPTQSDAPPQGRLCISSMVLPSLSGLELEWVSQVCSPTSGCREDARAVHPQADATVLQELLL